MQLILKTFLNKKYEDIEKINFEELCTWTLWPNYFVLFRGKSYATVVHSHTQNLYVMYV